LCPRLVRCGTSPVHWQLTSPPLHQPPHSARCLQCCIAHARCAAAAVRPSTQTMHTACEVSSPVHGALLLLTGAQFFGEA
jgi:hypothetical protein